MSTNYLRSGDDYEARYDARTLIDAEEIKADTSRFNRASVAMTNLQEEKRKEIEAIERVKSSKLEYGAGTQSRGMKADASKS